MDEDWDAICQELYKGVEGAEWDNLCSKFVEMDKVVEDMRRQVEM